MKILFADLETYSEIPINSGTHAYAEQAEVMMWAWAIDDGPVKVWDLTTGDPMPEELKEAIENPEVKTVWHNGAMFDTIILLHAMGIDLHIERVHDTMVQALCHSLPGALGILCDVLKIPTDQAKDKEGRTWINLFCKPRPKSFNLRRANSKTHPEEWKRFVEYAGLDIEAMRAIYKKLPTWNYQGEELELWYLDQKINRRGVAIDLELAHSAITAVEKEQKRLAKRTQNKTRGAVESATKRDALLAHILNEYGIQLPDLQKATLERRIADPDLPIELRDLLGIRLQASTTSTSKYKTLVKAVSQDGRLRGTLQFCGASRTGRWAGRLFQPQNLPRPTLRQKEIDLGIEALKAGCVDLLFEDVMSLTSSAIRGCLVSSKDKKLVVADLSNIEGRLIAWLAGEEWKLQAFRDFDKGQGHDLYAVAYAKTFAVSPETVMENRYHGDGLMRQIGKVMELMLGYEGGVGAFLTGAATYGIDLDAMAKAAWSSIPDPILKEAQQFLDWRLKNKMGSFGLENTTFIACDSIKRMWRNQHPAISSFWKDLQEAAVKAVLHTSKTFNCRELRIRKDGAWLRIRLPSGRTLCYPAPIVEDGKLSYMGVNQYSRKWARLKTYGGKLAENVTQAAARDILAASMKKIEKEGYQIVLSVHDELITEVPDSEEYTPERLSTLMTLNPEWAKGLPLSAEGMEVYRYCKD